jgi:CDP-diacylglycerol--serine O-phosphatidyltransferase
MTNETENGEQELRDAEDQENYDTLLPIDEHEEIVSEGGKTVRRRGIFLLPNLLTLGALFAGFYAIIAGMAGNFNEAGWAIFIAGILDGLDGRIARLTNTQSAFGAQFDSLSDMVSFGVAPSLIMLAGLSKTLVVLGGPPASSTCPALRCVSHVSMCSSEQLTSVSSWDCSRLLLQA